MTIAYVPPRPVPPPSRVEYKMPFWMFLGPEDEFAEWLREPWWRKLLGITTHDKRARKPVVEL